MALATCTLVSTVYGQPQNDGASIENIPTVIVSASRLQSTVVGLTQSVTVIDREKIEKSGAAGLGQLLLRESGVFIDQTAASSGFSSIYLQGGDPSFTVVMLDGVSLNDPTSSRGSAVDLSSINLASIERIEIVRGNASAIHGGAMAGVVNIITRQRTEGFTAKMETGGFGFKRATTSVAARFGNFSSDLAVSAARDGIGTPTGSTKNESIRMGTYLNNGPYSLGMRLNLTESENRAFPDDSGGFQYAIRRAFEIRRSRSNQFSFKGSVDWRESGRFEIDWTLNTRTEADTSPGVAPGKRDAAGLPGWETHSSYQRSNSTAQYFRDLSESYSGAIGLDLQVEKGGVVGFLNFPTFKLPSNFVLERTTKSVFGEMRFRGEKLSVQTGIRISSSEPFGTQRSPHLGFKMDFGTFGTSRVNFSRGSKLPSFYALTHPLVGNPRLIPEVVTRSEIGHSAVLGRAFEGSVTLFNANYGNLVDFVSTPRPLLVNRGKINIRGVESSVSGTLANTLNAKATFSRLAITPEDGRGSPRNRPEKQATLAITKSLSTATSASLAWRYVGMRLDSSIPTGDVWLNSYSTMDFAISRKLSPTSQLDISVDNLLAKQYEEIVGTSGFGRRLRISLTFSI